MTERSEVHKHTAAAESPIFLYDGDCAFCTTSARFIERRIPTTAEVSPWQFADLDALGVTQDQAEAAVLWVADGEPTVAGPDAIARLLVDGGSWWRPLGRVLGLAPVRWLAWPVYPCPGAPLPARSPRPSATGSTHDARADGRTTVCQPLAAAVVSPAPGEGPGTVRAVFRGKT